jgi:hypothetical protein
MKSVAVVSSGFLRNYRAFLKSDLWRRMLDEFDCGVYISTWNEDGYGSSWTESYTDSPIPEQRIREDFGHSLKFLRMESFESRKGTFRYEPIGRLLRDEPLVLEKYRSKFYSLKRVDVPDEYDLYFHMRFDMAPCKELSDAIMESLRRHRPDEGVVYTNQDVFMRPGCFGDIFQIMDFQTLDFMRSFYEALWSPDYLDTDIPSVPERILQKYFDEGLPGKTVRPLPIRIELNRDRSD